MKTIALITFIAIAVVFVWHLWMLIKEFRERPVDQLEDHDSLGL
jgi:hypothetical protein